MPGDQYSAPPKEAHGRVWYSHPREYGKGARSCRVTGDKKKNGIIRKYGLNMSRQAFREKAEEIGFKKVSGGRIIHV
ncbi:hypothetical protein D0869_12560 [Hortaea werneckii]|uniref:Ribosomal protein S14 n=2 Tax=Hortaea werneckii TaxID=91943 RepID=A0A3M6W8A9_HORWE|nr:hypothetical protein D0869_12560 [Hortaea werneckii]RMX91920.1 hypothetical protein D0868_13704 [Hortaea werneckii]